MLPTKLFTHRRARSLALSGVAAAIVVFGLTIATARATAQGSASGGLAHPEYLVSAGELDGRLASAGLVVLDAREPDQYRAGHIPGAVNLPLSQLQYDVRLPDGEVSPANVKPAAQIRGPFQKAGINQGSHLVIYDGGETYRATREWWMLDYYGHTHISVLDGGLAAWKTRGGKLSTGTVRPAHGDFEPVADPEKIATFAYVQSHIGTKATAVCDALSASSFSSGAIPGSINLPWTEAVDANAFGKLKGAAQLASLLESLHLSRDHEIIFYCRRGYVSSLEYFIARTLGYTRVRLYDGSLSDFTARGGKLAPGGK